MSTLLLRFTFADEGLPVAFCLHGVGCSKFGDGLVEASRDANVSGDDGRIAGARVTAGQCFAADDGILQEASRLKLAHLDDGLVIVELTDEEVAALDGGIAEEWIGLELHGSLAIDDAAALVR